ELSKMLVQKAAASVGEGFSKTHLIKEIRREIARVSFIISVKI
ncbi:MAG: 50S ribosomal protein L29, partial [Thiotrichales bacterium]